MYNASDLFKKAIVQPNRDLRIRCTIDEVEYEGTDIQSITIEDSILTSDNFKLGSATASVVELALLNMDNSLSAMAFEGKEVSVEIGAVLDKFARPVEYVSMGTFIVEEGTKEESVIKMRCVDKMIYFEKPYVSALTYPSTLSQILQDVCSIAGVQLQTTNFINSDFVVQTQPNYENVTMRQMVEYISELACGYAVINRDSNLQIINFSETDIDINGSNYYTANLSEYTFKPIDKLLIVKDGSTLSEVGTGVNSVKIENNILATNDSTLAQNIYNKINGFTFKSFTATWQGNPLSAPGDIIVVDGNKTFIAKQKFTFDTGLKCDVETSIKNQIQTEYQTAGPITQEIEKAKNEYRSRFEQTDERIAMEVEEVNSSIATLEINVGQIQTTVSAQNIEIEGLDGRIASAESSITQHATDISLKVSQTDYNGNTIASLINQSSTTISIEASKINLVGAVSVLSDISGNLGTITAGKINIDTDATVGNNLVVGKNDGSLEVRSILLRNGLYGEAGFELYPSTEALVISSSNIITLAGRELNLADLTTITWGNNKPVAVWGA